MNKHCDIKNIYILLFNHGLRYNYCYFLNIKSEYTHGNLQREYGDLIVSTICCFAETYIQYLYNTCRERFYFVHI